MRAQSATVVLAALSCSLSILWVNALTTRRWAAIEGSINGPKRPFFFAALVAASVAALLAWHARIRRQSSTSEMSLPAARALAACGVGLLAACFLVWFPFHTWRQIPFLDDWPIRYQAAVDIAGLLKGGAFTGWEWRFLGGYHSSSDATQGLGTLTFLPMTVFGPALGFHLTHVALFALVPILLWRDLSLDADRDPRVTALAVGAVCLTTTGYSYFLIRSGDTNSLGGVVMTMTTLLGAHGARVRRRWGIWVLVLGLALTAYAHPGFFGYASLYLLLDALVARDRASLVRAGVAIVAGTIASLPLTWEIWRYPRLFQFNNIVYAPSVPLHLAETARSLYYNVELLFLPWRWFNDFAGLTFVLLPVIAAVAWLDRGRARFHAVAALLTVALTRLQTIQTGYLFLRPQHMLAVFLCPVLAMLMVRYARSVLLRWSLVAVVALYLQIWWQPVPHVNSVRDFNRELVDRVQAAPGALVLLENNPHRNMNADPGGKTERSIFGTHFEVMVAAETGRRLYSGGYSDGWQWNPWKGQVVAGGTFMGHALASTPHDAFVGELRRWGVSDLFVWSQSSRTYIDQDTRFSAVWTTNPWTQYRLNDADLRDVAVATGAGRLESLRPHGAQVDLTGVTAGEPVIVRTNFHPAWTADLDGRAVPLVDRDGQIAFAAPCAGNCRISLHFPAHRWLIPLALFTIAGAVLTLGALDRKRP